MRNLGQAVRSLAFRRWKLMKVHSAPVFLSAFHLSFPRDREISKMLDYSLMGKCGDRRDVPVFQANNARVRYFTRGLG